MNDEKKKIHTAGRKKKKKYPQQGEKKKKKAGTFRTSRRLSFFLFSPAGVFVCVSMCAVSWSKRNKS